MKGFLGLNGCGLILLSLVPVGEALAQENAPLRTRNLSPMVSIYGLPAWASAPAGEGGEFALSMEIASHARLAQSGQEQLILDGETWRGSLSYARRLGADWSIGVEIPVYRHWGGVLDGVIDSWHSAFNLPGGDRNRYVDDQLIIDYDDRGTDVVTLRDSASGLGDVQVSLARVIGGDGGILLTATLKLPSGDAELLTGSGAADFSLSLLKQEERSWRSHPAGFYWGVGVIKLGEPELLSARSEDWAAFGVLGGSWRPFPRLGFKAQMDFHSRFYDSALDELGRDSIQVSAGGGWAFDGGRSLDIAIGEDLTGSTAPDVSLHVALRWGW